MSNSDVPPENGSSENEIESPVDGPIPDWMKMATSASSGPSLTEEDTPDWLKDIKAGKSAPKEEAAAEAESERDAFAGMSDLERLLAEEGIDLDTVAEERPEEAAGMSARDWMISTSDDELIRSRIGAEPITEEIIPPAPAETVESSPAPRPASGAAAGEEDDKMVVDEGLPDWLREAEDETPPTTEPEVAAPQPVAVAEKDKDDKMVVEEDLPDWLSEAEAEAPPTAEPPVAEPQPVVAAEQEHGALVVDEELPDWLREAEAETPPTAAPQEPVVMAEEEHGEIIVDEDLPDWLREAGDETLPTAELPVVAPEPIAAAEEDEKMVVHEDLPDWLREAGDERPPTAESAMVAPEPVAIAEAEDEKTVVDDDLPAWLSDAEEESIEEDDEEMPGWLRDIQEEELEEPASAPVAEPVLTEPAIAERGLGVDEDDLPDWLKEVQEDEAVAEPVPSTTVAEPAARLDMGEGAVSEDDLPDWLQEAQAGQEDQPLFDEDAVSVDDVVSEDELPEWLSDAQTDDSEPFEPSEPSPQEPEELLEEDLPDWLQEVKEEALELDFDIDDISGPPPEPVGVADVGRESPIEDRELPEWLRDIEASPEPLDEGEEVLPIPEAVVAKAAPIPVERGETEVTPDIAAEEELEEELVSVIEPTPGPTAPAVGADGMPDWLKKLREGEEETEAAPRAERPVPVAPIPKHIPEPQPVAKAAPHRPEPSPTVVEAEDEDKLPADAGERLKLAQAARDKGDIEKAVRVYDSLVSSGAHLDTIIEDMQQAVKSYPSNYLLYQIMGDAMMKDGRLQSALEAYREALEKLSG